MRVNYFTFVTIYFFFQSIFCDAIDMLTSSVKKSPIKISPISSPIKSFLYYESDTCNDIYDMEQIIKDLNIYDQSISFQSEEILTNMDIILDSILPVKLLEINDFKNDIVEMIKMTKKISLPTEDITSRLAIIDGVSLFLIKFEISYTSPVFICLLTAILA